ncbi:lyso-ornithine lipid acyltransferase [Arboricoccus pini]|uniref:Lyso-ornithine lipid acyltransferase n=1 Tax=Arboricoccus pini TaxID=1963835 RepID=A0A212Q5G5_9PROT|nr:lysophospholipid acyltransferase family protein [Arboricoccus pini]SNB54587.1 lyso-ornithine lipid acyltransferase [Arboricoccus pini]
MRESLPRAIGRAIGFVTITLALLAIYSLARPLGPTARRKIRRGWSASTLWILGIRLRRSGRPYTGLPTLYVANHLSYIDIPCIATCLDAPFIAKSEVAGWPLFGMLAKLTDTLFVRRHWREARRQRDQIADRLEAGHDLVLFGEGTSSDGLSVLPIKTSLLSVAEVGVVGRTIAIQPITLCFRRFRDGRPIVGRDADYYAWWGDATLVAHLWRLLKLPGMEAEIVFSPATLSDMPIARKQLGPHLRQTMQAIIAGNGLSPPPTLPVRDSLPDQDRIDGHWPSHA